MGIAVTALLGLSVLAATIFAIISIVQSNEPTGVKTLWILIILVVPVIGLVAWALAGPRG